MLKLVKRDSPPPKIAPKIESGQERNLKACLAHIRVGMNTGYAPNIYNEIAYQQLNKKERALIDNIFKTTFGWE